MSKEFGMSAMLWEMPEIIPRTEYSAHTHWRLINKVTGMKVDENSSLKLQQKASSAFVKEWDYGFMWNI